LSERHETCGTDHRDDFVRGQKGRFCGALGGSRCDGIPNGQCGGQHDAADEFVHNALPDKALPAVITMIGNELGIAETTTAAFNFNDPQMSSKRAIESPTFLALGYFL
jgi:hypothetical protein